MQKNIYIYALLIGFFMMIGCAQYEKAKEDLAFLAPKKYQCTVMKVYTGDRFLCQLSGLDNENIKLIGIRIPPEKQQEAMNFTRSVLKRGTLIKIEPETEAGYIDGDIPAYVFIQGDRVLNLLLVEKGLADLNVDEVIKYKPQFIEMQEKIQIEKIEIIEEN